MDDTGLLEEVASGKTLYKTWPVNSSSVEACLTYLEAGISHTDEVFHGENGRPEIGRVKRVSTLFREVLGSKNQTVALDVLFEGHKRAYEFSKAGGESFYINNRDKRHILASAADHTTHLVHIAVRKRNIVERDKYFKEAVCIFGSIIKDAEEEKDHVDSYQHHVSRAKLVLAYLD